ncbi:peptidase M16 [Rhodobacterales bacterium 52_120_T64]|nr:peptidase M16 [Rhodobacterales bacterium 52_120_T64]
MKHLLSLVFAIAFALPVNATEIQKVTSEGGITAWLVEEHSIPIVSIDILFRGGASIEPDDKQGATYLMAGLLEEGAGQYDAIEFLEATEALAARFSFDTSRDLVSISATVLRENLNPSMDLLRVALTEPRFDEIAFDRVRAQVNSIIRRAETNPRSMGGSRFRSLAFGDHPYARDLEGTLESIAALSPQDMHKTHQAALTHDRLVVGVVGDITPEELAKLLDTVFSTLPESSSEIVALTTMQASGGVDIIDHPSPQSVAIFGHAGIMRDDPDYIIAYVMNHILGTGFTSRLNQEIREKRGLTYGVGSFLAPYDRAALYMGSISSSNENIAEAIDLIRDEWAQLTDQGVTQEELEAAQKYLTGSYPLRFDSNGAIASILAGLQFADLPIDYITTRNDGVNAVTVEDINRVAERLVQPENLRFVIVGQPEGITAN